MGASRFIIRIAIFSICISIVVAGGNPFYVVSEERPVPVDARKADSVVEGITLEGLVSALGRGWMSPREGAGVITWFFSDGRKLEVWPENYEASEVFMFDRKGRRGRMWWIDRKKT
jgi:hypothetical protein